MQKRNGLEFLPGKDDEPSCSIFVHFLAEALRSDIKSILSLSGFFAGEMEGSEARKTKDKKELIYCKFVISWAALLYFTLIVYQYKIHT